MSMNNHVRLTGYIQTGHDNPPLEVKMMGSGEKSFATLRFRLSVPRDGKKDKDGKRAYDNINIGVIGRTAEFIAKYFSPGDVICLEGEIRTRTYEQNGETKYAWEVNVTGAGFPLGNKGKDTPTAHVSTPAATTAKTTPTVGSDDFEEVEVEDDLPF